MDPKHLFFDERHQGLCVYCGRVSPETRDHVPPKVLLDRPYPENLCVVAACNQCNKDIAKDEEYLACLLECAIWDTTDPEKVYRVVVKKILQHSKSLSEMLTASRRTNDNGQGIWVPDWKRVERVILKLARGHAAYEFGAPQLEEPVHLRIFQMTILPDNELHLFNTAPQERVFPEIGSRAFCRAGKILEIYHYGAYVDGWHIVQDGRYRYLVSHSDGILVRGVLSEYLGYEVAC